MGLRVGRQAAFALLAPPSLALIASKLLLQGGAPSLRWWVLLIGWMLCYTTLVQCTSLGRNCLLRASGRRPRAGCVPVRAAPGGSLDVLLVRSRKHPKFYIFPAGGVELNESVSAAAVRETEEEAGVVGSLGRRLGALQDHKSHTTMYVLHVERELAEFDESWRERRWHNLGVPGAAAFATLAAQLRGVVSPKLVHQDTLGLVLEQASGIVQDHEQVELIAKASARRR